MYGYPYQQYQPMDQLQQLRTNYTYNQQQDERIWVQNQTAAEAYLVAPNGFVRLWDSQRPVFYEKQADQTGKINMTAYDYSRRQPQMAPEISQKDTMDDRLSAIEKRLFALEQKGEAYGQIYKSDADDAAVHSV